MTSLRVAIASTGSMGSAIAKVLLGLGHDVTVWNRNPDKSATLGSLGAHVAPNLDAAIDRADVIICVPNPYSAVHEYLAATKFDTNLSHKVVVVLSSCESPEEPRGLQRWLADAGAAHIDGKMFGYAGDIGQPTTPIAYCGDATAFEAIRPLLTCLGKPVYLGDPISHAFLMEAGLTSWFVATCGGAINGLALCRAAGLPLQTFIDTCIAAIPAIHRYLSTVATDMIPTQDYDPVRHGTASIGGVLTVLDSFASTFRDHGVEPQLLASVAPAMRQKVQSNEGHKDIAAIIDVFVDNSDSGNEGNDYVSG